MQTLSSFQISYLYAIFLPLCSYAPLHVDLSKNPSKYIKKREKFKGSFVCSNLRSQNKKIRLCRRTESGTSRFLPSPTQKKYSQFILLPSARRNAAKIKKSEIKWSQICNLSTQKSRIRHLKKKTSFWSIFTHFIDKKKRMMWKNYDVLKITLQNNVCRHYIESAILSINLAILTSRLEIPPQS